MRAGSLATNKRLELRVVAAQYGPTHCAASAVRIHAPSRSWPEKVAAQEESGPRLEGLREDPQSDSASRCEQFMHEDAANNRPR